MAKIPLTSQLLASSKPQDINLLLRAVILWLQQNGDEDVVIVTEQALRDARNYTLVVADMQDEGAFALSVRPR
jgi:hypothetical protein